MTFSDLGYEKAQLEIQQQEENSPLAVQSELNLSQQKPLFTL